jgi:aminoglycoside phosphotransferase (APT) family kinase protein
MLLAELPGEDGYTAPLEARRQLIDLLIEMQVSTIDRIGELEAAGVPDKRWGRLLEAAEHVVLLRAPDDKVLRRLLDGSAERVAAIEECGLPYVLVHGDAHSGNARIGPGADPGIWFDWGDCRVGHPILDVAVLLRPHTEHADELIAHWLDGWERSLPGADAHRAWQLVRPLAALGNAVVYQGFLDGIEASERPYHAGDVLPCLAEAADAADPTVSEGHRDGCPPGKYPSEQRGC